MPEIIGPNDPALDSSLITALFPGEVVTRAFVRDVDLPYGAGTMALITLDNGRDHTRPNTFGPAGLISLREALDAVKARATPEAGEQRIAAVGVTGKPFIFAVGADLKGVGLIGSRDQAKAVVVVWSSEAVKSQWVRSEADRARLGGKIVQLRLDPTRLPNP